MSAMDLSRVPKSAPDTRYLLECQRKSRLTIEKVTEEYQQRVDFLKNRVKELEDSIFESSPLGSKIRELFKENLNLATDAQCLSMQLDTLYPAVVVSNNQQPQRNYPSTSMQFHQNHAQDQRMLAIPMSQQPNGVPNASKIITFDTSGPYAVPLQSYPYPVQQPMSGYPVSTGNQVHLSPHQENALQINPAISGSHRGSRSPFYHFKPSGSVNILHRVPPAPSSGWPVTSQLNYPVPSTASQSPPVLPPRPRPSDLPGLSVRPTIPPPHRPLPPTPPRPARSPNHNVSPKSSNEHHQENDNNWECPKCTFKNHSEINECEMCNYNCTGNTRGSINRSLNQ